MIQPSDIILQASRAVLRASSRPEDRHTHSNLIFVIGLHKTLVKIRDSFFFRYAYSFWMLMIEKGVEI